MKKQNWLAESAKLVATTVWLVIVALTLQHFAFSDSPIQTHLAFEGGLR